jgi:hypothetical protein
VLTANLSQYNPDDYIELYISQENMGREEYVSSIKGFNEMFSHLWVIPQTTQPSEGINENFEGYDIEAIVESTIPEDLTDLFQKVKNRINLTKEL